MTLDEYRRKGGCLIFAWGPPWHWFPSWQRSKYHAGRSLTWLWWGLYYFPIPVAQVMIGAIKESQDCAKKRGD